MLHEARRRRRAQQQQTRSSAQCARGPWCRYCQSDGLRECRMLAGNTLPTCPSRRDALRSRGSRRSENHHTQRKTDFVLFFFFSYWSCCCRCFRSSVLRKRRINVAFRCRCGQSLARCTPQVLRTRHAWRRGAQCFALASSTRFVIDLAPSRSAHTRSLHTQQKKAKIFFFLMIFFCSCPTGSLRCARCARCAA